MGWTSLKKAPTWAEVQDCAEFVHSKASQLYCVNDEELFDEYTCVRQYVEENVTTWANHDTVTDERWRELFTHFDMRQIPTKNIRQLVEFSLALPGTNAAVERMFSLVNSLWTEEKNRLEIKTVKAIITVKTHFSETC